MTLVLRLVALLSIAFLPSLYPSMLLGEEKAQNDKEAVTACPDEISDAMGRVYLDAQELEAFSRMQSIISRNADYQLSNMSVDQMIRDGKIAASRLQESLDRLERLKPFAKGVQLHTIDGLVMRARGRLDGFKQRFAANGTEPVKGLIDTCDGLFDCVGFRTTCEKTLGGKWRDLGACAEACYENEDD